jgi:hypothetical protein
VAVLKLDIGCGKGKKEGFTGMDISAGSDADIIHDVRVTPWPIDDGIVEEVYCCHFFEHLDGEERISFMAELYRIMKPGAQATFITPYYTSSRAIQDPTHKWPPVCEASYLYFNKKWREENNIGHYSISSDFDFTYGYALDGDVGLRSTEFQQFAVKHYTNSVLDLQAVLTRRENGVSG